jgi:hypothetical protein
MFAIFTAIAGFLGSLILTIVLTSELMPRSFVGRQIPKNHLVLIGFCIFAIAWIGAYIGYRLGS